MSSTVIAPNPRVWSLRFKNDKSTILLYVDPLQPLHEVRTELLRAINATNPDGKLNGFVIPTNADDIMLGRPADDSQPGAGFVDINGDAPVFETSRKGKGKAGTGKNANSNFDCPKAAGMRADGVVAFKFRSEHEWLIHNGAAASEKNRSLLFDDGGQDDLDLVSSMERWNVKLPTMEETYGEDDAEVG